MKTLAEMLKKSKRYDGVIVYKHHDGDIEIDSHHNNIEDAISRLNKLTKNDTKYNGEDDSNIYYGIRAIKHNHTNHGTLVSPNWKPNS